MMTANAERSQVARRASRNRFIYSSLIAVILLVALSFQLGSRIREKPPEVLRPKLAAVIPLTLDHWYDASSRKSRTVYDSSSTGKYGGCKKSKVSS